jgi:S-adenosylmethionine hydrolase
MRPSIITLLTDFGTKDYYVASMKGVILRINPQCLLVDITHQVSPQDIRAGAFLLAHTFSYFPKQTIHLAVVDPEVGGKRRPILLKTRDYFFVGPDNGLFTWVGEKDGVDQVVELTNPKYFLSPISSTFHGRDIFAPVAAYLSLGVRPESFGKRIDQWVTLDWKRPEEKGKRLIGEILLIDHFGNLITNVEKKRFFSFIKNQPFRIKIGKKRISKLSQGYWEAKKGEAIALFGSTDFLEIAVREGSAQERLKAERGDPILIERGQ